MEITRSLLIRIGNLEGDGYPLHLYSNADSPDHPSDRWSREAVATAKIPRDAFLPDPRVAQTEVALVGATASPGASGVQRLGGSAESQWDADRARKTVLTEAGASEKLEQIGAWLYSLLNRDDVGKKWRELRRRFPQSNMRTFLEIEDLELERLPWELLHDDPRTLFLETPMCHGPIDFMGITGEEVWPLRVLIVVGSDENDQHVAAEQEIDGIESALRTIGRSVYWEICRQPTHQQLRDEIEDLRPHILHFIGHGRPPGQRKKAHLEISNPDESWEWTVNDIAGDLDPAPRLAFLNTCHSGDASSQAGAWSMAAAFLELTPAVLAMQGPVDGAAAALFSGEFYRALANGKTVEHALLDARKATALGYPGRREWCLGRLRVHLPPEQILTLKPPLPFERRSAIAAGVKSIRAFVGRKSERRTIWKRLDPIAPGANARALLLVEGEDYVGRTELMRCCLECCAQRGRKVVQVEFERGRTQTFLDVLRSIRDAIRNAPNIFGEHLDRSAFDLFDHVLRYALDGTPARQNVPLEADPGGGWKGGDERWVQTVFDAFRKALSKSAGDLPPLIVLLARLNVAPGDEKWLRDFLFRPVVSFEVPNVRMVLVLKKDESQRYGFGTFGDAIDPPLTVHPFRREDFVALASEFVRFHGALDEETRQIIRAMSRKVNPSWMPIKLHHVLNAVNLVP